MIPALRLFIAALVVLEIELVHGVDEGVGGTPDFFVGFADEVGVPLAEIWVVFERDPFEGALGFLVQRFHLGLLVLGDALQSFQFPEHAVEFGGIVFVFHQVSLSGPGRPCRSFAGAAPLPIALTKTHGLPGTISPHNQAVSPMTPNRWKSCSAVAVFLAALGLIGLAVAERRQPSLAAQTNIVGPAGSGQFGNQVAVLPNGNFVVTDPGYDAPGPVADVGRVYLYNGSTLALINTMTGTAANDAVGSDNTGRGVRVLANGDYVVSSSNWNGGRGAVTRCSASTGCPATISSANSLVGGAAGNNVGGDGVLALPNGNYVVRSSGWDSGATMDVGALTWCDGAAGCTGTVSSANSRVGSRASDQIGLIGLIVLTNGNYISQDVFWDNGAAAADAGAVTFCTGTAPCTGAVSAANSLVGTTANEYNGNNGIFPLTNGNYVVCNGAWDNGPTMDVGAATFCSGTTGCHAVVGPANSLIGTKANDQVGLDGIAVLSNGNYVVRSRIWNSASASAVGAATFCNGNSGCVGTDGVPRQQPGRLDRRRQRGRGDRSDQRQLHRQQPGLG